MKTKCLVISLLLLAAISAQAQSDGLIFKKGGKADPTANVGDVFAESLVANPTYDVFHMIYEAGSHNDWHIHPDGYQVTLVLDGEGYYQEEGQPKRLIRKGDVVNTAPNVKHWSGATPESRVVVVTITDRTEKGHVQHLEPVTEETFNAPISTNNN